MRLDHIALTVFLVVAFGALAYLALRLRPQSNAGPKSLGIVVILGMILIIQVSPQPDVTTVALLIYGPLALIAYLVFLWRWRATHKPKDVPSEDTPDDARK